MSPELIIAVKERIGRKYSDEAIRAELRMAGHTDEVIDQVINIAHTSPSVTNLPDAEPPAILNSFSAGWKIVMTRFDLVLALASPLSIMFIWGSFIDTSVFNVPYAVVTLIVILCYVLVLVASMYIIVEGNDRKIPLSEGIAWASKHGLKMLWLYILVMAIMYSGMILFLIPGIIVSVLIFFTPYVHIKEGLSGMTAIMRSRELVAGRWWLVFEQLFKILLLIIGMAIGVGIIIGLLVGLIPELSIKEALLGVVMQFLGAILSLVCFYAGTDLYRWLVSTRPATNNSMVGKWKYITLGWLGFILPLAGILAAIILASLSDARDTARQNAKEVPTIDYKEQLQNERNNKEFSAPTVPVSIPTTTDF